MWHFVVIVYFGRVSFCARVRVSGVSNLQCSKTRGAVPRENPELYLIVIFKIINIFDLELVVVYGARETKRNINILVGLTDIVRHYLQVQASFLHHPEC